MHSRQRPLKSSASSVSNASMSVRSKSGLQDLKKRRATDEYAAVDQSAVIAHEQDEFSGEPVALPVSDNSQSMSTSSERLDQTTTVVNDASGLRTDVQLAVLDASLTVSGGAFVGAPAVGPSVSTGLTRVVALGGKSRSSMDVSFRDF